MAEQERAKARAIDIKISFHFKRIAIALQLETGNLALVAKDDVFDGANMVLNAEFVAAIILEQIGKSASIKMVGIIANALKFGVRGGARR